MKTTFNVNDTALRSLFQSRKKPADLPPLPVFNTSDVAGRDALHQAMEGRYRLVLVDTNFLTRGERSL